MDAGRFVIASVVVVLMAAVAFGGSGAGASGSAADPFATVYARQTEAAGSGETKPTPIPRAENATSDRPEGVPSGATAAEVVGHVDGDKLRVRVGGEEREVLLIGIDAPELDEGPQGECYAEDAAEGLEDLAPEGDAIYLVAGGGDDEDNKNRLLRFAWVDDGDGALFVNEALVADGFASFQAREGSDRYDNDLQAAERSARDDGTGLWGECGGNHVEIVPPTAEPELGDKALPAPIGTTLTDGKGKVTLTSAYTTYQYGSSLPTGGYVFLVMEATVENVDPEDNHGFSDTRFAAEDLDTGADFDEPQRPNEGGLEEGDLSTGEYASGIVGLEIQETATNVLIRYRTEAFGGKELFWVLNL